jgi:hypothetical protein
MGGAPFVFTANVVNDTAALSLPFTLVVAVGHCSCNPSNMIKTAPPGAMAWNRNGVWTSIPYDLVGGGTDYLYVDQFSGYLVMYPGDVAHYTLEVSFDPNVPPYTPPTFVNGTSTIDVTMVQMGRTLFPQVPSVSIPINVAIS